MDGSGGAFNNGGGSAGGTGGGSAGGGTGGASVGGGGNASGGVSGTPGATGGNKAGGTGGGAPAASGGMGGTPAAMHAPVNPNLIPAGRTVLDKLAALTSGKAPGVIVGQSIGSTRDPWMGFQTFAARLQGDTGRWPGMINRELDLFETMPDDRLAAIADLLIDYYNNRKGMVTLNWAPMSPSGGHAFSKWSGNLADLTKNGEWIRSLDRIAGALQRLQRAGVPVLWRPLQENNGPLFWYATGNGHAASEFIPLYRHLFDYFTKQKGLNNLIWVYSPVGSNSYMAWPFPGLEYVDVVAPTTYNDDLNLFGAYNDALKFGGGKPVGVAEYGPDVNSRSGSFDNRKYARKLEGYPAVAYWVSWHDWDAVRVSLVGNSFTRELMNDPYVLTAPLW